MQCLPQYDAENSVTNRLAKQLKEAKADSVYLLEQCSSAIHNVSSSAFRLRSALGVQNFHAAMTFATQTNVEFTKDIAKSFTDRCRSLLTLKMSNATLFKHFARRKCRFLLRDADMHSAYLLRRRGWVAGWLGVRHTPVLYQNG